MIRARIVRDGDIHKRRDTVQIAFEVAVQIGEMHHQHVGQVADVPPGPDILSDGQNGAPSFSSQCRK